MVGSVDDHAAAAFETSLTKHRGVAAAANYLKDKGNLID
jgi:hypothetical protein